jgi:hypothetical protein
MVSWSSLRPLARKTGTVDSRYNVPLTSKPKDKPTSVAVLPYVQTTYGRLSRMLARHNIKSVGLQPRKISGFVRPVKDDLGLRTPGVYSIPYECGRVYIGQTGRFIATRIKEHSRHIRLGHPEKSAVAEHRFTHDHLIRIQIKNPSNLFICIFNFYCWFICNLFI